MLRGFLNKSIGLLLLGSIASSTTAADLKVRVADGGGKPLVDAVASLRPASGLASAAAAGTTAIMDQRNLQFAPHVLPIQAGTKISMPNSDQVRHHVYSFSPAKHFELRMYKDRPGEPGDFRIPGIVSLGCNIHDWMLGYIVVLDTPYFAKSDQAGVLTIVNVPAGDYLLDIWQPRLAGPPPKAEPITLAADSVEKSIVLAVDPPQAQEPPSELELKFRRYQGKPDAP